MTLTEFVLARIEEREALARAAGGADWWAEQVGGPPVERVPRDPAETVIMSDRSLITYEVCRDEFAAHIEEWNPARVLRECAAHRQIVTQLVAAEASPPSRPGVFQVADYEAGECAAAEAAVRAIASIWSDHEDWREEWTP